MPNDSANALTNTPVRPFPSGKGQPVSAPGGAAVNFSAELQPSPAKLGDVLTLFVRASHPAGLTVDPPVFPKSLGTFEVLPSTPLSADRLGDAVIDRFEIPLQNFTTGPQILPGIPLTYRDSRGHPRTLQTPTLSVTMEMIPPGPKDGGDIRGIKGAIGPVAWSPWWWLLLTVLAAGAAAWFWKKRLRKIQGPPPPPPIPADEEALARLAEILAAGWIETGDMKAFYIALGDALRAYLEHGFRQPALERTTTELMRDLRKRAEFPSPILITWKDLFETCDLVKFAKFRPDATEATRDHATGVRLIQETQGALHEGDHALR